MSYDVTFRSDFTVDLVQHAGGDDSVLRAMLVSTNKDDTVEGMDPDAKRGRLNYLMQNRHGTPWEHNSLTFRVEAPIFVFREWHRHRIGIAINELSGRYSELPSVFYLPGPQRALVQEGKPGAYTYVQGTPEQYDDLVVAQQQVCYQAYAEYQEQLHKGVAREVARMVLPVNIYSAMYWTCNARSLMNFLSLRVNAPDAAYPSKPMWEIDQCAQMMEAHFAALFPLTHDLFVQHGRVAP